VTQRLVLFEDAHWGDLSPLTDLLPVHALAFGGSCLATRWMRAVPEARPGGFVGRPRTLAAWRPAHAEDARADSTDSVLAIQVAALPGPWFAPAIEDGAPALWLAGDRVVGARGPYRQLAPGLGRGADFAEFLRGLGLPESRVDARVIRWPWELMEWNPEALSADLESARPESAGEVHRLAALYEPQRISVGAGTRVDAFAVLDARPGPIRLERGVIVQPHTVVVGPCVVGEGTELLGGVVSRSTIGPQCRIAGEVDSSVWQGYANKRHHGFVGHSVIGEWSNLGALTTTSDLKNTYGEVRVWAGGREMATGSHKIGSFIGAHVKTGIGTLLPTGASIGTGSNLFGGGRFAPKRVPPFTWWDGERAVEHRIERLLETARIAMSRRGKTLDREVQQAIESMFEATVRERNPAAEKVQGPA
jgi:UDP-N-acetylglucosamine diphosphorylase/glucosamine-1-phosphate N-acetyltransferase